MADDFRPAEDDRIARQEYREPPRYGRRGRRIMTALVAIAAVLGFGVVLLYAYNKGKQEGASTAPPVIQAQEGPTKIRPESPGDMKVPNRDKEVFTRLEAEKQPERVERLLPLPEKPMTPPSPPEPAAEPAQEAAAMEPAAGASDAPAKPDLPPPPPPPLTKKALNVPETKAPEPKPEPAAKPPAPKTAAKPPAPAPKPAATGRYRVQLSSLRSEDALRKSWSALQKRHGDLLGDRQLIVERTVLSGGRGTFYRMQSGPFASRDRASAFCSRLKQRKLSCLVVRR